MQALVTVRKIKVIKKSLYTDYIEFAVMGYLYNCATTDNCTKNVKIKYKKPNLYSDFKD